MTFDADDLDNLYRYCLALTGQRQDARDLMHNAIERYLAVRNDGVAHPLAYLRRIARNCFYDEARRRRIDPVDETVDVSNEDFGGDGRDLESVVIAMDTLERLWNTLSSRDREALFLWAHDGLSASEIALQLGQPRGTVLARLHRLKLRLREHWRGVERGRGHE